MSLAHLVACTGSGGAMSFEDGYAYIYSHIQEERLRFIYQCGARYVLFEDVLNLSSQDGPLVSVEIRQVTENLLISENLPVHGAILLLIEKL